MIPNLKVDIIYYKTQSDFELEFNLSGYCRMRIFKSSAETTEELLNCLAKDLDRSRIVLIVTDVISKDCGVKTVSEAVGLKLVSADKEAFKIQTDEDIFVPKNSVPLVSKSGSYGGCIAESNIQSIIMITDNRALRHELMKSLVHQYIFDIAQVEAYKQRQLINETASEEEEATSTPIDEAPSFEDTDKAEDFSPSNVGNSIFSSPGTNLVLSKAQEATLDEDADSYEKRPSYKRNKSGHDIVLLVIVILLLIGFGVLAYFFIYLPLSSGSFSLGDSSSGLAKAIETWLFN